MCPKVDAWLGSDGNRYIAGPNGEAQLVGGSQVATRGPSPVPNPDAVANVPGAPSSALSRMITGAPAPTLSDMVPEAIRQQQDFESLGPLQEKAGEIGAAALSAVDSATLHHLATIDQFFTGSGDRMQAALQAAQQMHPAATAVGNFGGMLASPVTRGVMALGGAVGAGALRVTPGVGSLVDAGLTKGGEGLANWSFRGAANLVQNLASGSGAITAYELADRENRSLPMRLSDARNGITSIQNLLLSGVAGGVSARYGANQSTEIQTIAKKFERVTGQSVPADVLTNRATLQNFMDQASQNPALANDVAKVRKNLVAGMGRYIADMGSGTRNEPDTAANAVRDLQNRLTTTRRDAQRAALTAEGGNMLSVQDTNALRNGMAAIIADNKGGEENSDFLKLAKALKGYTEQPAPGILDLNGKPIPGTSTTGGFASDAIPGRGLRLPSVDEIEALRKQTANVAYARPTLNVKGQAVSDKSVVDARRFYQVIADSLDSSAPAYSQALKAGKRLRDMVDSLPSNLPDLQVNDRALNAFFKSPDLLGDTGGWKALTERGAPEEVGAAKGWLFHELVSRAIGADGVIDPGKLARALTQKEGPLNRQIIDTVLPGIASELEDAGKLSAVMRKGSLSAPGSQTAKRGMASALQQRAPWAVAAGITGALSNPFAVAPAVLGGLGVHFALKMAQKSLIDGAGQDMLRRAATGTTTGLATSPVALQQLSQQLAALRAQQQGGSQ